MQEAYICGFIAMAKVRRGNDDSELLRCMRFSDNGYSEKAIFLKRRLVNDL